MTSQAKWLGRPEDVFFSESIHAVSIDGYGWRIECVTFNNDGSFGPFSETAIGGTLTKWGARRKIRRWKKQFLREALSTQQPAQEEPHGGGVDFFSASCCTPVRQERTRG